MGSSPSKILGDQLFQLKLTSKQLLRNHTKSLKAETEAKLKCKKAIEKGNMDGARIYAQNAIREKNQALNYLRLSARIDAVAARVQTALDMHTVSQSMVTVTQGMDRVLASMDVDRISSAMDTFEKQFEDLDVRSGYMENAIGSATSLSTPEDQVDGLVKMIADEHGLALGDQLDAAGAVGTRVVVPPAAAPAAGDVKEDDLAARLAALHRT